MAEGKSKVCIIGLDGGNLEVLDKWVASGDMPHLAALMARGSRGVLRSTLPPCTGPAWTSMTTGVGPGTHGIFDFVKWNNRDTRGTVVSSADVALPRLWDVAGASGYTVGVVSVPVTFPARAVNGFLVAGMLSPRDDPTAAFPGQLLAELRGQGLDLFEHAVPRAPAARCVRGLTASHVRFERALLYLMSRFSPDFLMCVFRETDRLQHRLWHYCAQTPAADDPGVRHLVRDFFRKVDGTIGLLTQFFGPDASYFVVSDHGLGPTEAVCALNWALADAGLLALDPRRLRSSRVRHGLVHLARRAAGWAGLLGLARRLAQRILGSPWADAIAVDAFSQLIGAVDWSRTRALVRSRSDYGAWVNLKGREPYGIVEPGADYERARADLIAALQSLKHPRTGEQLVTHLWRKEDVLSGPHLPEAPDVFFFVGNGRIGRDLGLAGPLVKPMTYATGVHTMDGVIVACGPGIRAGAEVNAQITDVAPTALYAMGLPIPAHMEGQVLTRLFTDGYLGGHQVVRTEQPLAGLSAAPRAPALSAEDAEAVKSRLRDLGYL